MAGTAALTAAQHESAPDDVTIQIVEFRHDAICVISASLIPGPDPKSRTLADHAVAADDGSCRWLLPSQGVAWTLVGPTA
jgi:hypothetical protein